MGNGHEVSTIKSFCETARNFIALIGLEALSFSVRGSAVVVTFSVYAGLRGYLTPWLK
jgi:hypothetical protein